MHFYNFYYNYLHNTRQFLYLVVYLLMQLVNKLLYRFLEWGSNNLRNLFCFKLLFLQDKHDKVFVSNCLMLKQNLLNNTENLN